jgi:hypothetical protein
VHVRQRLEKGDWIVLVGRGLSVRGQDPLQPNRGMVIDLIIDTKFTAARRSPASVGANYELGVLSTTANRESAGRILYPRR